LHHPDVDPRGAGAVRRDGVQAKGGLGGGQQRVAPVLGLAAGVVDDVDYFTAIHIGTGVPAGTVVCGGDNFMATTKFDVQF
ncbi:hypothetical protein QUH28_28275, partial [Klebsiella pneumoniae]|nr:hypothetical protein [Klebsiella pneumoniae]